MVILDEKALMLPPPPPYVDAGPVSPPPFPVQNRPPLTLATLPPHLLLRIVYETFSQGRVERQRKVLYWLTMSLRRVNRAIYIGEHTPLRNVDTLPSCSFYPSAGSNPVSHLLCTASIEEANTAMLGPECCFLAYPRTAQC